MQYVGEKVVEEVTLHVYYKNGTETSVLYDDGGEGYGYQNGQSTTRRFKVKGTETGLVLQQEIEGDYQPSFTTYRVVLHGLPFAAAAFSLDGADVAGAETTTETGLTLPSVVVGAGFTELVVG
jgi:alpha-glucosidase